MKLLDSTKSLFLSAAFVGMLGAVWTAGANPVAETTKGVGVARTVDKSVDRSEYVGAQKCGECHAGHFAGWKETGHNKMIRPPTTEGKQATVLADFNQPSEFRHFELKDVKWVVGSRWKQRFIGEVDGNDVVFPAQWSITAKKWMPYTGKSDWWWEKHQDWKSRPNFQLCAGCHSTGMDVAKESWAELNISCEACHGPGREHSLTSTAATIVNPARLSTERSMDICLSCHQAGKPNDENFAWPVGYQPGLELAKFWNPMVPEKGKQTAEFWHNGTAHKNRVQGNTFVQSVMHKHDIQCTNCHDVHSAMHQSMTIKSAASNALCLTCHGPSKDIGPKGASLTAHTHHGELSTGSRCIECHMPKIAENGVPGEMRNHTFDFISPLATQKTKDPNSCNTCHSDKTPEWALEFVQQWWPKGK
ncbi:MAG: cytochrome c3 family protein [Verrucomicrobiota bacterium]